MSGGERPVSLLLHRLLATAEEQLVRRSHLQPVALAANLSNLVGSIQGAPVQLHTERATGGGWESLTIATISTASEELCSLTVIGIPAAGSGTPILGVDLIAMRGTLSLIAVDLAPTDEQLWQEHAAGPLQILQQQIAGCVVPRKRPVFTDGTFSDLALIAGAKPGSEAQLGPALDEFLQRSAALGRRLQHSTPEAAAESRRQSWLAAERRNRKEHNALAHIFGPDAARRYLDDFLFAPAPTSYAVNRGRSESSSLTLASSTSTSPGSRMRSAVGL